MLNDCLDVKNNNILFNINNKKINDLIEYQNFITNKKDVYYFYRISEDNVCVLLTNYYLDLYDINTDVVIKNILNGDVYRTCKRYEKLYVESYSNNKSIIEKIYKIDYAECMNILNNFYNKHKKFISNDIHLQRQIKIKLMNF